MNRIDATFSNLRTRGRKGLIPYVMAGFPGAEFTVPLMRTLADAGADVIELGIPFSDPMADGPLIQQAGEAAIRAGIGLPQVLEMAADFRRTHPSVPLVLMGYGNSAERYDALRGGGSFSRDARKAGVDGVLIVDFPPEMSLTFTDELQKEHLHRISLAAPTSSPERISRLAAEAVGFIYAVAVKGVTGAGHLDVGAIRPWLHGLRQQIGLPLAVGFGIGSIDEAARVAESADAVVIGSRLIALAENLSPEIAVENLGRFISEVRAALDSIRSEPGS